MAKTLLLLLLALPTAAIADKNFESADDGDTWDCGSDARVNIRFDGAKITFTGACEEINLDGKNAKLTADEVASININGDKNSLAAKTLGQATINGNGNKVTYKKPKSGKKAGATVLGKGNAVTKVK